MSKRGLDKVVELPALFSAYLVHRLSVSEVNHFVAGTQVFSFDCCTVVFYHLNVV